ncbi:Proprotein convertase subtilisin/kexin type 7 precursor [hydrothermal vent metagenome]|uniref:Proprotein convertase subtilisin/kexin type 7 n=1 Tax=hydrothermal vent metagenome TaxID=652676 RepID=A0A1W1C7K4_9ZZZZ
MKKLLLIVLSLLTIIILVAQDDGNSTVETNTSLEINSNSINVDKEVKKTNIEILYLAMFNRIPDTKGLEYWNKMINDENWTMIQVSNSMFDQNETKALYPELYNENMDSVKLITSIYQNIFNRYPDGEGLAYWDQQISAKLISPNIFILSIINGAIGKDKEFLKSLEKISTILTLNNLLVQEDLRDVLNILSEKDEKSALEYIDYIINEPTVRRVRPTVEFDGNPSKDQVKIKVSSSSYLVYGLNVAIYNLPMDRWDISDKKILSSANKVDLVVSSNIYGEDNIKIRLQSENGNIISGVTKKDIVIKSVIDTKDSDGDGVLDRGDVFPNDANESIDSDGDGVGDNADKCNNTKKDELIGADGCPPDTKASFSGDLMGTIYRNEPLITGKIVVTDPNDGEAGMTPENKDGIYGILIIDESGSWTFTLTNSGLQDGDIFTDKFLLASKGGDAVNLTIVINGKEKIVDNNSTQ